MASSSVGLAVDRAELQKLLLDASPLHLHRCGQEAAAAERPASSCAAAASPRGLDAPKCSSIFRFVRGKEGSFHQASTLLHFTTSQAVVREFRGAQAQ